MIMIAGVKAVDENQNKAAEQNCQHPTESDLIWTWSSENCDLHRVITSFHVHSRGCGQWCQWHSTGKDMEGPPPPEQSTQTVIEHMRDGQIHRISSPGENRLYKPMHKYFQCLKRSSIFCPGTSKGSGHWLALAMGRSRIHQKVRIAVFIRSWEAPTSSTSNITFNPQFLLSMSHEMADGCVHKEWVKMQQQLEFLVNLLASPCARCAAIVVICCSVISVEMIRVLFPEWRRVSLAKRTDWAREPPPKLGAMAMALALHFPRGEILAIQGRHMMALQFCSRFRERFAERDTEDCNNGRLAKHAVLRCMNLHSAPKVQGCVATLMLPETSYFKFNPCWSFLD